MALVLCFHFQFAALRGLNMSAVSERTCFRSSSASPSCNCRFFRVYVETFTSIYEHVNFTGTKRVAWLPCICRIYQIEKGFTNPRVVWTWVCVCVCLPVQPGQHRSLGLSISKVRSLKLDSSIWSNELVEVHIDFLISARKLGSHLIWKSVLNFKGFINVSKNVFVAETNSSWLGQMFTWSLFE